MVKHTPGPWVVCVQPGMDPGTHVTDIATATGFAVGTVWGGNNPANARLIAAAPELYEALKAMDDLVDKLWKSVPWGKTFNLPLQELNEAPGIAKRALAKAEGKE